MPPGGRRLVARATSHFRRRNSLSFSSRSARECRWQARRPIRHRPSCAARERPPFAPARSGAHARSPRRRRAVRARRATHAADSSARRPRPSHSNPPPRSTRSPRAGGPELRVRFGASRPPFEVLYVIVPWIGVMAVGYAFGTIMTLEPARRRARCLSIGLTATALFIVIAVITVTHQPSRPAGRLRFYEF